MLINLRNALMTGKRLPYDAEVEYLESTGTQWIDTGIISDGTGLTVEVTCSKTTSATQEMSIVGRSRSDGFDMYVSNSKFELWNSSGQVAKNPTTISAGEVYDVIGSTTGGAVKLSVNGVNSPHSSVRSFPNGNIVLFRHNSKYYWVGRLMFCKIWQNGVLVRDYIPVRKGTVGYLYDRVSGKLFGNAGTGDFVLGPDVVPVEYIETDGNAYIDIPVHGIAGQYFEVSGIATYKYRNNTRAEVWCADKALQFDASFYSLDQSNLMTYGSRIGRAATNGGWGGTSGTTGSFIVSTAGKTINGVFAPLNRPIATSFSTLRFGRGISGLSEYTNGYPFPVKELKIVSGTETEFYGMAIRVGSGSTWEGAMMDVLTRRIYRNAGTGAFAYGNDLKYPIPAE